MTQTKLPSGKPGRFSLYVAHTQATDLSRLVASLVDRLTAEGIDEARVSSIIADAIAAKHESVNVVSKAA